MQTLVLAPLSPPAAAPVTINSRTDREQTLEGKPARVQALLLDPFPRQIWRDTAQAFLQTPGSGF